MNTRNFPAARQNRRAFLARAGLVAAGCVCGRPWPARAAAPQAVVQDTRVISLQLELYHGWPTLARRASGELVLVYSGGREAHVCPFGRVEMMVSQDGGQTWGWPQVLMDSAIDDRDAGVLETPAGTLLVTTFTSLAYDGAAFRQALAGDEAQRKSWPEDRLRRWRAAHERLTEAQRQAELGQWMIRSTDGGVAWSARSASIVNSPHGPFALGNGHLLYAGKELWTGQRRVGVCVSKEDGARWEWLAEIPVRPGDEVKNYHELHGVEAAPGRIVVHIRNHNPANNLETLQTESTDGGRTWSVPHPIGVWGLPSHLLRLRDGRLLMTYGHRRAPFGNQARLSADAGRTWSAPLLLSGDGVGGDLGYPSTVELPDGLMVSIWYEVMKGSARAVLRQARWRLES